ncbi:MAG TPA: ABC-F family ATP-binding cassette domain-containing protein [Vicinamibacterales bacterium]|nr:ABC-F family ATP-binding cassette domain-containing protein [Vicinamibacterales bacterium]
MIQLSGLTKRFGDRVLLDEVNWQITSGERVGLAGPNGAGKTTLLRMLAGLDDPDAGRIVRPADLTVGYLPQDGIEHSGRTLFDEASQAFASLLEARAEIDRIEHALADTTLPDGEHERLLVRYHEVTEAFQHGEGHSIDLRVTQVLDGLGFSRDDFGKPTETFSGGWQMRIALARLLLSRPTLLLLDEPTNHLDLDARNWLESFLRGYPHAVILVSHDRYFLDTVVTRISEISLRTIADYVGTYSAFLVERDARLERLRQARREQDEEMARLQAFIDRFRYQATKAAQVQSRIKMLDRIVPIEVPPERKRVHFTFPTCPKSGRMVIELAAARKAYGELVVLDGINLHIERGDRIALVAPNGAGKSTLMRLLAGVEPPDAGTRRLGHQVVMQYFAQDEANRLDPSRTVHETMQADSPVSMVPMIRNILGGFLFTGDDIYKRAGVLSGGERTRLAVARMLLRPANTLLLDEPTNHLDLDSKDVLLDALADFGGTLIFVSHDRYFVDRLANKIVSVGHRGIEVYPGTYEQFLWSRTARSTSASSTEARPAGPARPATAPAPRSRETRPAASGPDSYRDKKRADAETRREQRAADERARRVGELESRIAEREAAIKALEADMAVPGFYDDRTRAEATAARHQALMWEVGDLMNQWEALQTSKVID